MNKHVLIRLAGLILAVSFLSGCIWAVEDDGFRGGGSHDNNRGEHRSERRDHR
jgi:hypothetical protein